MKCKSPTVVALGTFDGVHLAHQSLLRQAVKIAKTEGYPSVAFTFRQHPLQVVAGRGPKLLTTLEEKERLIRGVGIDDVHLVDFTKEFANLAPEDFVKGLLLEKLGARVLVVGYDYTFGKDGRGNTRLLSDYAQAYGFRLEVLNPVRIGATVVSSTVIRERLLQGQIEAANGLLGYPFTLTGKVIPGEGRGRRLGFPTANIQPPPEKIVPGQGVYVVRVPLEGKNYYGLLIISTKPTFHNQMVPTIELFIADFSGDLYQRQISVEFLEYLRPIRRFHSPAQLQDQMHRDLHQGRQIYLQLEGAGRS
ncbi:MAG: bifunctional riboflavin kinase/FAD synthetase [Limnochordia bacterium]|jgi:riboflavin kinase/FMN adenylyltransferase